MGNIRKLYTYGNVVVDLEVHEIRHTIGDTIEKETLSRRECDLISYLIQNRGRIISREKLLEKYGTTMLVFTQELLIPTSLPSEKNFAMML